MMMNCDGLKLNVQVRLDSLRCELCKVTPIERVITESARQIKITRKVNEVKFVPCGRLEVSCQNCFPLPLGEGKGEGLATETQN